MIFQRRLCIRFRIQKERLEALSYKIANVLGLRKKFDEVIRDLETRGVIQEAPQEEMISPYPTLYMPHRLVVKETIVSTKIRSVFDVSTVG